MWTLSVEHMKWKPKRNSEYLIITAYFGSSIFHVDAPTELHKPPFQTCSLLANTPCVREHDVCIQHLQAFALPKREWSTAEHLCWRLLQSRPTACLRYLATSCSAPVPGKRSPLCFENITPQGPCLLGRRKEAEAAFGRPSCCLLAWAKRRCALFLGYHAWQDCQQSLRIDYTTRLIKALGTKARVSLVTELKMVGTLRRLKRPCLGRSRAGIFKCLALL